MLVIILYYFFLLFMINKELIFQIFVITFLFFLRPEEYQSNFLVPNKAPSTPPSDPDPASTSSFQLFAKENIAEETLEDVVRIPASYDMGWSTRGTGRNYDSLNGFGAAIGTMSGMVLDYSTCNRSCKKCEIGHHPSDHDCRKNFFGSAKAMEPRVAKKIIVDSEILREQNIEVGILIGDDDSSTISTCRNASNHPIIKQSDVNHTSAGVKKALYKL